MTAGRVTLVGIDGGPLGAGAMAALARARLVVGWPEHVALVRHLLPPVTTVLAIDRDLGATLTALKRAEGERVVLAPGDPGFFGIVHAVGAQHEDLAVVPAVSSVGAAFAAAGTSWDDAHVVSAHARPAHRALAVCRRFPKVAVLTGPAFGPAELGAGLANLDKRLVVAERLGYRDQRVTALTPAEAAARTWTDPNVVMVFDTASAPAVGEERWSAPPRWTADRWALPASAFTADSAVARAGQDSAAATAMVVRAVALGWLGPGLGDLVWDVGTGDGAMAVEAARLGAAVVAVDDDAQRCARARATADRHGVPVEVVQGRAPAALAGLPDPDAVFVGGGAHLLTEIVRTAADRARRAVVVALRDEQRLPPLITALEQAGMAVEATRIVAAAASSGTVPAVPPPGSATTLVRGGRR